MNDLGLILGLAAFGSLFLAIVAIVVARRSEQSIDVLKRDINAIRGRLWSLESRSAPAPGADAGSTGETSDAAAVPPRPDSGSGPGREPIPPSAPTPVPVTPLRAGPETESAPREPSATAAPPAPAIAVAPPAVPSRSLEEQIGARWLVWIGSVAMALAGLFLVKYSFDRNLLTAGVRVALGLGFGLAMLGGGQWLHRRYERIAQGLSGAGIAVLYASLLAGVHLYGLISRPVGFGLMALTTAAAVILSLRQGQWIALLGLLGGFLTPALIGSDEPNPGVLFTYLFLLQIALVGVGRRRNWVPVLGLVMAGGMGWAGAWIGFLYEAGDSGRVGTFIIASVILFAAGLRPGRETMPEPERNVRRVLAGAGLVAGLLLLALQVGVAGFDPLEWGFLALLGAGCLVLARLDADFIALPYVASGAGLLLLLVWSFHDPADAVRCGIVALLFGLLYAAGAYGLLWGAKVPAHWATISAASGIGYLLVASGRLDTRFPDFHWGLLALAAAAAYTGGAVPVARRRHRMAGGDMTLAIIATGITALASLAAPMELERAWIGVAWAVEVAAIAWIHSRLRLPLLPRLAAILAGLVAVRLFLNPAVTFYPLGGLPVWNWLLYGYGIPLLAFGVAAWTFRRGGEPVLSEWLEVGALLLGLALLIFEVRHLFHLDRMWTARFSFTELGTLSVLLLMYAWGLLRAAERWPHRPLAWGGTGLAIAAPGLTVLVPGLVESPLFVPHRVGTVPIWNGLLFVYGLPALLALLVALRLRRRGLKGAANFAGSASLVLVFLLISLEVRQAFQGDLLVITGAPAGNAEWYGYSIAWILFGTALLLLGIRTSSPVLRYASLVVMLLSVGKVFLLDTAQLADLYRVFSFLGLGASLLFLAYLYQRFVFRSAPAQKGS